MTTGRRGGRPPPPRRGDDAGDATVTIDARLHGNHAHDAAGGETEMLAVPRDDPSEPTEAIETHGRVMPAASEVRLATLAHGEAPSGSALADEPTQALVTYDPTAAMNAHPDAQTIPPPRPAGPPRVFAPIHPFAPLPHTPATAASSWSRRLADPRARVVIASIAGALALGVGFAITFTLAHRTANRLPALGSSAPNARLESLSPIEPSLPALPRARCPVGMVHLESARFRPFESGARQAARERDVVIDELCADRTEVTTGEYRRCVRAGGCDDTARSSHGVGLGPASVLALDPYCTLGDASRDRLPMNCIDWTQAVRFCSWRGARLASGAEWEYLARGGDDRPYPWGSELPSPELLNGCGLECAALASVLRVRGALYPRADPWTATADVASAPGGASPFRAMDMAGNVAEWTADRAEGALALRIARGGSWLDTDPIAVRVTARRAYRADTRLPQLGLRCVSAPTP